MKIYILIITVVFLSACQQKKFGAFEVGGKIENAGEQKIALQELPLTGEQPVILDSVTLGKDGKFELKAIAREESLYQLILQSGQSIILVNDGEKIRVRADLKSFRGYIVEGSEASSQLHTLLETLVKKDSAFYVSKKNFDSSFNTVMNDSLAIIWKNRQDQALNERRSILKTFIKRSGSPVAILYAMGQFDEAMTAEEMKLVVDEASSRFPEHAALARFKNIIAMQTGRASSSYALMNQQAPEIRLPSPAGDTIALSSFRGKWVLVDFWASWCGPCRKENPNVVAAYNKFRDKNFTILGVSLDEDKPNWEEAIRQDGLTWPQISDLKYWSSPVVNQYQFQGIPFNVLVDPSGKIVASELRGARLEQKLAELIK